MMTQLHDSCMSHQRDQYWHNNWDLRGKKKIYWWLIYEKLSLNRHVSVKVFCSKKNELEDAKTHGKYHAYSWTWKNSKLFFLENFRKFKWKFEQLFAILFCSKNRTFTVTLECIIIFSSNSNLACSLKKFWK